MLLVVTDGDICEGNPGRRAGFPFVLMSHSAGIAVYYLGCRIDFKASVVYMFVLKETDY